MVYVGPLYSTSLLPPSCYFVKRWTDPRFCLVSADTEEELVILAKRMGRHLNPMGRKDTRRAFTGLGRNKHPDLVEKKMGSCPVYYIMSGQGVIKAREEGAILVDEQGNYCQQQPSIGLVVQEGSRACEGTMKNGDPCPNPAKKGRLFCDLCSDRSQISSSRPYTGARYKQFLPEKLARLYEEALSRPDLLELENQIAVIDARIMETFEEAGSKHLPSWEDILIEVSRLRDPDLGPVAVMNLEQWARDGASHDAKWAQVQSMMEQQRKLVETEIRRKKELNLMIPVDRIMLLMASIADVIKRHVKDPATLQQIKREMGQLLNANTNQRPAVQVERGDVITVE